MGRKENEVSLATHGGKLRAIRNLAGVSIREAAEQWKFTKPYLSLVENNKKRPSDELTQRYLLLGTKDPEKQGEIIIVKRMVLVASLTEGEESTIGTPSVDAIMEKTFAQYNVGLEQRWKILTQGITYMRELTQRGSSQ